MAKYLWCEDSGSGYQFWQAMCKELYPDIKAETKRGNSGLCKAAEQIIEDDNEYYIMIDEAIDNPCVLRELTRLNRTVSGKDNIRLISIHSFEFALLSFEYLENWVFAEDDELRIKRKNLLDARKIFVKLINGKGSIEELNELKNTYGIDEKKNQEKTAAKLLFDITRNTGFETNKSKVGECFIKSCCEYSNRQDDDICGLDSRRLTASEKMEQLMRYSVLQEAFEKVGL